VDMISFGTVFLELVFGQLHRLPAPGEEVFTDEFAISCGGAITSATAAAAAGIRAGLCTRLGDDLGSQVVTEHCASAGVDLSPSARVEGATAGITVVLNFDDDRGFVTHLPSSVAAGEDAEMERWHGVLRSERPAWCYLHAGRLVPPFLREARSLGCKIMLDMSLGDERERDIVIECVRLADVFVPNTAELLALTGAPDLAAAVCSAAAWGAQLVVTHGAAGALIANRDGAVTEIAEGVQNVPVKDLTGAGDNFAGALIAGLIGGAALTDAVAAANAAGSRAIGMLGAVGELGPEITGAGWPLRPAVLNDAARVLAGASQPGGRSVETWSREKG
jgi:sugar/nucleoside kinase (ribokinase family)